jgi:hypothetical protein
MRRATLAVFWDLEISGWVETLLLWIPAARLILCYKKYQHLHTGTGLEFIPDLPANCFSAIFPRIVFYEGSIAHGAGEDPG